MSRLMNIGQAAEAAGVSAKMIRHYEQIGLVPAATRTEAGYRQYSEREVSVLRFIRQSRRLGFSMQQIAELLGLWSDRHRASREVKAIAQSHLDALENKLREMAAMQRALKHLLISCQGGDDPDCAILEELALTSPHAPEPGAVGAKPLRRKEPRSSQTPRPAHNGPGAAAGLMAWTQGLRLNDH